MYISKNQVRMHDTDMAGRLYFARQFRFAHDALEDFVASEGFTFEFVFHQAKFVFVIVHCEADFFSILRVGDYLEVEVSVDHVGNSSFSVCYAIYKTDRTLVGSAKTIHVTLDCEKGTKIPIPEDFRKALNKHLEADRKFI